MLLDSPHIIILGTAQDGGYPQAGCRKECCLRAWQNPSLRRLVTSVAIIKPNSKEMWLIDATPDFKEQIHILDNLYLNYFNLSGLFLTHGHIGHYTGLINLGCEVMDTKIIDVYAMPMMLELLKQNAPWNQLILNKNIRLNLLSENNPITLTNKISLTPIKVPHRDELTETVCYKIMGPNKSLLFLPDIDFWNKKTLSLINNVDVAFIDGTFFDKNEILERNLGEVPHPFITDSMQLFGDLPGNRKRNMFFIHFNHTNPVLNPKSKERQIVINSGFSLAEEKQIMEL